MVWTLHIRQRHKNPLKHFNRIQTMNVGRWSELERKDEAFPCILKSKQSRQQKVTPGATLSPWLMQMFLQGCLSFQPINGAFLHGDVKDKILKTSQFRIESIFYSTQDGEWIKFTIISIKKPQQINPTVALEFGCTYWSLTFLHTKCCQAPPFPDSWIQTPDTNKTHSLFTIWGTFKQFFWEEK